MKRRRYTIAGAAFLPDGCQLALFDHPTVGGRYPGIIIEPVEMTIQPGMRVEMDERNGGHPFDGVSTVRLRFNGGPWLDGSGRDHPHSLSAQDSAFLTALAALRQYQEGGAA